MNFGVKLWTLVSKPELGGAIVACSQVVHCIRLGDVAGIDIQCRKFCRLADSSMVELIREIVCPKTSDLLPGKTEDARLSPVLRRGPLAR